jgi:hypothetical protein
MLDHTGEEQTAVRFRLDVEGKVVDVHQRSKSLLETFRNVRANGGRPGSQDTRQDAAS